MCVALGNALDLQTLSCLFSLEHLDTWPVSGTLSSLRSSVPFQLFSDFHPCLLLIYEHNFLYFYWKALSSILLYHRKLFKKINKMRNV